jgi:hypothetical protein
MEGFDKQCKLGGENVDGNKLLYISSHNSPLWTFFWRKFFSINMDNGEHDRSTHILRNSFENTLINKNDYENSCWIHAHIFCRK